MISINYPNKIIPNELSQFKEDHVNFKFVTYNTSTEDLKKEFVKQWQRGDVPLFKIISIETNTECNFTCTFCPVAKGRDPRPKTSMKWSLLEKIARELEKLDYCDNIFLYCNNEPLLDKRLPEIVNLFRKKCPNARIKILTNGILLNLKLVQSLFSNGLSILEIDNYTDGVRLIKPAIKLIHNIDLFKKNDIVINMRKRDEVLTNRAGSSPNALPLQKTKKEFCGLPFSDINIMPNGQVSLCCVDALNTCSVGSLSQNTLIEVWKNSSLQKIRSRLLKNDRTITKACMVCDYNGFRTPPSKPVYI